jgi:hypothetical protein
MKKRASQRYSIVELHGFVKRLSESKLKVPKRGKFVTELFTLSDPIWIGDMRTEPKKPFE